VLSVGSAPESARMASVCCLVAVSVEKVIQYISALGQYSLSFLSAMNAPHLCKLRKNSLYRHWPRRNGVNKTAPFLHFQLLRPLRTF
jgi:hypothetical protein